MKLRPRSDDGWLIAAILVCILTNAANIGGSWWGDPAEWWNLGATGIYLLFWVAFSLNATPRLRKVCLWVAILSLVGNLCALLCGLPIFLHDVLILPALILIFLTGMPLYGLRMFLYWEWIYLIGALLSALWLLWCLRKRGD